MVTPSSQKRLQNELMEFLKDPPSTVSLEESSTDGPTVEWIMRMQGAEDTLYEGETFRLKFIFGANYPIESPIVVFIGPHIPVHPHIYSNGHICLSILTEDWSPALTVQSVCLSILSMLSSCKEKKPPIDNDLYLKTCSANPDKVGWLYEDENI